MTHVSAYAGSHIYFTSHAHTYLPLAVNAASTHVFMCLPYFTKEAVYHTWNHEIYGYGIIGTFTTTHTASTYVPARAALRVKAGRRQSRRIKNSMDESEAGGRVKRCSKCDEYGHTYKKCSKGAAEPSAAEAGPSGNRADGRRPSGEGTTTSRRRGRRSSYTGVM